jgi:hypothetical protein
VHDGPIVLVTLGSLRADAAGFLADGELTPHLDALAAEADWAGRAVAPSSWVVPSLGTLLTGLSPWQHGAVTADRSPLAPELVTLAEALAAEGYASAGYVGGLWMRHDRSWHQGFRELRDLGQGRRAAGHLASLGDPAAPRRQFLWVHVRQPSPPYERHDPLRDQMPRSLGDDFLASLPPRLDVADLERWADPAAPVPYGERRRLTNLYRYGVAEADRQLGDLLAALEASGRWDETLLVVTSLHGEELGDYRSTGSGGSLGRALVEVPLVVKLPRSLWGERSGRGVTERRIAEPLTRHVALGRLPATLAAAAGATLPPAAAPSLFEQRPGGILSELYARNGYNELSWLEEDDGGEGAWQLVQRSRFAPPEADYHRARLALYGVAVPGLAEPPGELFARLATAFANTPPLTGAAGTRPEWTLSRWSGRRTEVVDDPARAAAMAERLARRWRAFAACERTLGAEVSRRAGERAAAGLGGAGTGTGRADSR